MLEDSSIIYDELDYLIDEFVQINYNSEIARQNVKYYLVWFKRFLEQNRLSHDRLTVKDLIRFRSWIANQRGRHNKPLSAKTIRQLISFIKAFYDFLEPLGVDNPFKELPQTLRKKIVPKTKSEKVPREFSDEELKTIFSNLRNKNKDVYLACLIGFATGARLQEVLALRAEDVLVKGDSVLIIIRAGKGFRERVSIVGVPYKDSNGRIISEVIMELNEEAKREILKRVSEVRKGYIFGDELRRKRTRKNIQQTLYRLSKKLGIEIHFHNFRSNWGAKALQAGVPLEYVAFQLGHKYTSTTEKYYARVKDEYVLTFINNLI